MNAAGCRQWCETHDDLPTSDFVSFGPFRLFAAERLVEKADEPLQLGGRALDSRKGRTDRVRRPSNKCA